MIHRTAKGMLLAAVVGTLLLGTVGCGQLAAKQTAAVSVRQETAPAAQEDKEEEMNITITAGNRTIRAKLNNNEAAKQLWKSLPRTFPMKNLYGREMCFRMGAGSLPIKQARNTGYQVGDISYWPPMGSLVILYKQNGEVFEQQPIGHIDEDVSFFDGMPDTDIRFEKVE